MDMVTQMTSENTRNVRIRRRSFVWSTMTSTGKTCGWKRTSTWTERRREILFTSLAWLCLMYILKPIAADIPTAESLKLTSRAHSKPEDPSPPKAVVTESSLKRDDWMLAPSTSSAEPPAMSRQFEGGDESLTEGYGEPSTSTRALEGGIDFFSSLGKEKERKPKPDLPNPDKVNS
jgi:hypothetical protein